MNANAEQTSDPARAARDALRETSRLDPLGWPVPPFDVVEAWEPIDRAAALAWAQERSESYRAELEFELDPPDALEKWIADQWSPDQDEDDPPTDAEPPPRPPRDPWNISGEPILSQRGQLAAVDLWTDAARARAALTDPRTHPKARSRLDTIVTDLERIAEIEMQLRADAAELGARVALSPGAEADLGDIEARATASRRRSSAGAVSEARRVLALAPTLALAAAREGAPTPTPTPAEPAPADPQTRAAYLRQLAEESDREAARRRAEADALDPRPEEPFDLLASRVAALRVVLTEPRADLPDLIRIAIRTIGQQTERLSAYNAAAGAAARAAPAPAPAPTWQTGRDGDYVYSAPLPPVLARIEPDLDDADAWYWSVGERRGTAGSSADARAICDLFLNLEAK